MLVPKCLSLDFFLVTYIPQPTLIPLHSKLYFMYRFLNSSSWPFFKAISIFVTNAEANPNLIVYGSLD
jgi:hypothetical protein